MLTLTNRIDMRPGAVPLVIHLGQYDSDFSLVFELYSSAGNFTVESGTTAMIRGTKTDGNAYDADATIDVSAKTVTVAGSEQMTAAKGRNVYELVLTKSDKVLSTANFILDVERAAMDADTIASESVLKELNAIIDSAATSTQAAADAASAADRAEDAAESVSSASAQIATNTADIADLKADLSDVNERIDNIEPGLSDEAKDALLACFRHVLWKDDEDDYYSDLEKALYPDTIQSISASFAQGQYMFSPTDELDDLKPFLTVTAHRKDGTDETLNDYTLSGTLDTSSAVITVTYLTFDTTFTVNVKQLPSGYVRKEYIQSDKSQYINTGITEVDAGSYAYKMKAMPIISDASVRSLGHIFSSLNMFTFVFRHETNGNNFFTASRWGANSEVVENVPWSSGSIYTVESYIDGNKVYINGVLALTCARGDSKSESNVMYLLGYSGAPDRDDFRYCGRLYAMKMYNLGTNVKTHDFIPCINANNVVGMYDMVTDRFLSPTVGTLIAG